MLEEGYFYKKVTSEKGKKGHSVVIQQCMITVGKKPAGCGYR